MRPALLSGIAIAASCFCGAGSLMAGCASDVVDFTATGTFADAGSSALSGNLDIDIGCSTIQSGNLTVTGTINETFTNMIGGGAFSANTTWTNVSFSSTDFNYRLFLDIDLSGQTSTNSLGGYAGGNLCTTADNCSNTTSGFFISSYSFNPTQLPVGTLVSDTIAAGLSAGTLTTGQAATPEPSSFLLMGIPALWLGIRSMRRRA